MVDGFLCHFIILHILHPHLGCDEHLRGYRFLPQSPHRQLPQRRLHSCRKPLCRSDDSPPGWHLKQILFTLLYLLPEKLQNPPSAFLHYLSILYIPFFVSPFLLNKCSKHMLFHLRQTVFILFLAVQINLHIRVCCQFLFIRVIVAHVFVQACHFVSSLLPSVRNQRYRGLP